MYFLSMAALRGSVLSVVVTVLQHLHALERNQSGSHHRVEHRQERVDLFLSIDNLKPHGQVLAKPHHLASRQRTALAKAQRPAQNGRPRQSDFACLEDDRLEKWAAFYSTGFSDENAEQ